MRPTMAGSRPLPGAVVRLTVDDPIGDRTQILLDEHGRIDGRYQASSRHATGLRGSSNQRVHLLSERYTHADIEETPEAEILIDAQGRITMSGVAPIRLRGMRGKKR